MKVSLVLFCLFAVGASTNVQKIIGEFAVDFYQSILKQYPKNAFFSPLSVQISLATLLAGANGPTATDISYGIDFNNSSPAEVASNFHTVLTTLMNMSNSDLTLDIANKVYIMQGEVASDKFADTAQEYYTSFDAINFNDADAAANTINTWVEGATNNKIQNLITADQINANTELMLVSAVYFKGLWLHPFDKGSTAPGLFYTSLSISENIEMMHVTNKFSYGYIQNLNATVINLPYSNSDLAMMILLPDALDGLEEMESNFDTSHLKTITSQMYQADVDVSIPKFTVDFEISLQNPLTDLGMGILFSGNADLSGILTSGKPLSVSSIIHQAHINVDENGSEAAAATAIEITDRMFEIPEVFTADHPFAFIIYAGDTLDIIFAGRFAN